MSNVNVTVITKQPVEKKTTSWSVESSPKNRNQSSMSPSRLNYNESPGPAFQTQKTVLGGVIPGGKRTGSKAYHNQPTVVIPDNFLEDPKYKYVQKPKKQLIEKDSEFRKLKKLILKRSEVTAKL